MAKKSSTNAVKKIEKQINEIKKNSDSKDEKTPVATKKELKEGIEKAKKTSSTKKSTSKKSSTKKTASSKTTKSKTTTKKKSTTKKAGVKKTTAKSKKEDIIVVPNKPVKIKEKSKKEDKPVRDEVVVTPSKKKKTIPKKKIDPVKDEVIVAPEKNNLDEKKEISEVEKTKRILSKEKKFDFTQNLDNDIEDYKFADDIENDINNGKYIDKAKILIDKSNKDNSKVKRKRKGKNKYIIDIESTREYKDLERDLRSLYDKTNDIIDDIDKPVRDEVIDIDKLNIHEKDNEENNGFLDRLSQKVLNTFVIILSIIFIILLIVVIGFVIYVSTV